LTILFPNLIYVAPQLCELGGTKVTPEKGAGNALKLPAAGATDVLPLCYPMYFILVYACSNFDNFNA